MVDLNRHNKAAQAIVIFRCKPRHLRAVIAVSAFLLSRRSDARDLNVIIWSLVDVHIAETQVLPSTTRRAWSSLAQLKDKETLCALQ